MLLVCLASRVVPGSVIQQLSDITGDLIPVFLCVVLGGFLYSKRVKSEVREGLYFNPT